MRRAFTVVELLVAVVVLLAVIIATSKIFNTASKVSSTGEATADVLQQATVVEEQLRRDLNAICRDGYMAIQCVAVRNDVNQVVAGAGAPLLNPQLASDAIIRCDQVVFFTAGTEVSARWAGPGDLVNAGGGQQARATRVYYGHGVQFPGLANNPIPDPNDPNAWNASLTRPLITGVSPSPPSNFRLTPITPWTWFDPTQFRLGWRFSGSTHASGGPRVTANQPECRQWVLARKAVLLADDGGRAIYYPEPANVTLAAQLGPSAAPSVFGDRSYTAPGLPDVPGADAAWYYQELRNRNRVPSSVNLLPSPTLQSGWTDIAASDLDKIRRVISPTLRLQNPVQIGTINYLSSVSAPWSVPINGGAPVSWPSGGGAPAWPGATPTVVVGNNADAGTVNFFSTQRDRIMRGTFGTPAIGQLPVTGALPGLLGWPRAEKSVANTDRRSEMLTSATLVTNCSSFQVDWTWEPLTGRQSDSSGQLLGAAARLEIGAAPNFDVRLPGVGNALSVMRGYEPFASGPWPANQEDPASTVRSQPWFGFPDGYQDSSTSPQFRIPSFQQLGVDLAQSLESMPDVVRASNPADRSNFHMRFIAQQVEGIDGASSVTQPAAVTAPFGNSVPVRVYTAVFGFNQDEAYTVTPDGFRVIRDDYTPWPTQIRVTCTLHDSRVVLDRGREFQFVLDIPKRRKD
ncbi:MAG: hypothetical protein FJ260_09980 [Planctomycetes bacterium]|nr:hypothetical protein [Planctomycetota bacterium]